MSFSIFSFKGRASSDINGRGHRVYLLVFFGISSACLSLLLAASVYIQPLEGELTRLGSYSERDFGGNKPQYRLKGDANLSESYDGEKDVLIVGDSFSTNGVWQPFFAHDTGLSYSTLDLRKTNLADLLESRLFRQSPPKVLIVQPVEREFVNFFRDMNLSCDAKAAIAQKMTRIRSTNDFSETSDRIEEKRKLFDLSNINMGYTAKVVYNGIYRLITGLDTGDARRFNLTTGDLFSNRMSREILIYAGDMDKVNWTEDDVRKAACSVKALQDRVEANGATFFILMVAPDKSSVYADFISGPVFREMIDIYPVLYRYGINAPRIDIALKQAINGGERDIYSPNGTHWSPRGYEIAAKVMAEAVRKP